MRRCYKCGAKMLTNYIVCGECEKKLEARRRMNMVIPEKIQEQSTLSRLYAEIAEMRDKIYRDYGEIDDKALGEYVAYQNVLRLLERTMR